MVPKCVVAISFFFTITTRWLKEIKLSQPKILIFIHFYSIDCIEIVSNESKESRELYAQSIIIIIIINYILYFFLFHSHC